MKFLKIIFSILILIISVLISLGSYIYLKLNKGFYEGYLDSKINLEFTDVICFYKNTGIFELINISNEGHKIKSLNFSKESLENIWRFVTLLNKLRKGIQPCTINMNDRLIKNTEHSNTIYLNQFKKFGKKILEFIPLGDKVNKGIASIELALQFKFLIDEIDKLNNFELFEVILLYKRYEEISTSIGRLTKSLEELFNIEDLKLIESLVTILSDIKEEN